MTELPSGQPHTTPQETLLRLIDGVETVDGFADISIGDLTAMLDEFATNEPLAHGYAVHKGQRHVSVTFLQGKSVYNLHLHFSHRSSPSIGPCQYSLARIIENVEKPAKGMESKHMNGLQIAAISPRTNDIFIAASLRKALELSEGMNEIRELVRDTLGRDK
jgi:hypothetical protein